jgi:cytochrome c-type biogenesis protein CcmI
LLTAALVLGALLAVAAVLFVARPLLREQRGDDALEALAPEERRRLELSEERDRALAALKELEFDHRTGKVSDEDYRTLLRELRRNAADALRALDLGTPQTDVRDRS